MSIFEEDFNLEEITIGTSKPNNALSNSSTTASAVNKKRWFNSHNGFFCLPRAIRDDQTITNSEFRVLVAIASFVMLKDEVTPKLFTLSKLTGLSRGTISRATTSLEKKGWLIKQQRQDESNIYYLTLPERFKNKPQQVELQLNNE